MIVIIVPYLTLQKVTFQIHLFPLTAAFCYTLGLVARVSGYSTPSQQVAGSQQRHVETQPTTRTHSHL